MLQLLNGMPARLAASQRPCDISCSKCALLRCLALQDADSSKADVGGEGAHAGQLRLLKSITGVFRPGVLTALMGASGAGAWL
jgi:hypothetical protein